MHSKMQKNQLVQHIFAMEYDKKLQTILFQNKKKQVANK